MSTYEKLLLKFLENPRSLHLTGIKKILEKNGYEVRMGKGSHMVTKSSKGEVITIPIHNKDCKGFYKEKVKKMLFGD